MLNGLRSNWKTGSAIVVLVASGLHAAVVRAQDDVAALSGIEVTDDPLRVLPNEISGSTFGFAKPILETPRSVSFVSQETIELFGLSGVEDLARVTPSVYSPARFGIQGSVNVRGVSADSYIRGMRRIALQGNVRSVLAAMDSIEVVKGPPSPIYGMGKIGGYTNFTPKSGRAQVGGYLTESQGFAQMVTGSLSREEFSAGIGGPMTIGEKRGGYYFYTLLEDSDSYYLNTPYDQKIFQLAGSIDDAVGPFRLEAGINYQESDTAGALTSRVSQDLVDNGRIVTGSPLVNLDLDDNGRIGFYELHEASPVLGNLSAGNQPIVQRFAWPTDADGNPLPSLDAFPQVPGIPESLYNYLVAECGGTTATGSDCPDPTGLLRAQGIGGAVPISGYVPIGMALDPRTTGYATVTEGQRQRSAAHERELNAKLTTAYFDLIYDRNPDFTMKNQVFLDRMDQYKISNNPLYLTIDNEVLEDKFTLTKRIDNVPSWLRVNSLMSANIRRTRSRTTSGFGGDIMANRPDITDPYWNDYINGRTPNTTFETAADNGDLDNGGTPTRAAGETTYWEYGVGALFDIDLFDKLNLLIGTRYDYSKAENVEEAGTFNENTGTSASPGTYRSESSAEGSDSGTSWSASLSYRATPGVIPYVTFADASAALDSSSNRINSATIEHGHIGSSELVEAGIKLSGFDDALFFSLARYDQTRTNVSADEDDPTLGAYVTSTEARGVEAELKWIPKRGMSVSLFGLRQKIKYSPNTGANLNLSARALGFMDVVDPATGEVIYPAEAFLYGGRANIVLPDNMPEFQKWTNNPESQAGGYITYQFPRNIKGLSSAGFTFGGNYTSDVCSGRLCTITIPSVTTLNASVFGTLGSVYFKLDVTNLTDESFYRPRLNNNAADMLLQAMPGRRYALTARMSF